MTDPKYMRPGLDFAVGKLVEELGELSSALGKTIRWGWHSYNPELPEAERVTNEAWVRAEMDDVIDAIENLRDEMQRIRQPLQSFVKFTDGTMVTGEEADKILEQGNEG